MAMLQEKLKVTLLTGRTIEQGVGKEAGKGTKEYFESTTMCYMDVGDMKKLDPSRGLTPLCVLNTYHWLRGG